MTSQINSTASERFFILSPQPTDDPHVYLDASEQPMKWSGNFAVPSVGTKINAKINSIGISEVKGYCESHGYLGLMVLPLNPPDWYRRQVEAHVAETMKANRLGPKKAEIERLRIWPGWICEGIAVVFGFEASI